MAEIAQHSLQALLRQRMRPPELYLIFQNKYGVQTFEANQDVLEEIRAFLDIIFDDINSEQKLYFNFPL